ncbi:T-complex protein 11-like protein [Drosera capensis]
MAANESETILIGGDGGSGGGAIVMCFPANDGDDVNSSSPVRMPRRLRRRLMMSEARSPVTGEEIEAKLRDADLRRQQFYEFLASKARPKPRSPTWSSSPPEDELSRRIEARLNAAEQKRLGILAKAQMRLARLDEQRQAAKSGVELRFEQERGQLEVKVVSRVQQAEANRLHMLKTRRQLRAARKERIAQSLTRKIIQESKYKECVRSAIHQKRVAAERKRIGLLEAERSKAHARLMRVQRAAHSVYTQRELERMRKKGQLEDRLQRARRQRAEYIRQRKGSQGLPSANMKLMNKEGDLLARKLARCWRQFVKSKGTTYSLAKAYEALNTNEKSVLSMPFEQLARQIESEATIRRVKSLLDRFETRLTVKQTSQSGNLSGMENIDHLLKRVGTPKRRGVTKLSSRSSGTKKTAPIGKGTKSKHRVSRYPVRIVLCAYMILGHPDAVLSGKGEHELALAESAVKFIQELEKLIKVVLQNQITTSHHGNPVVRDHSITFKCQLEAFDKAWCSYLYHFVVWKVKDARSLEEDLVRAACQLELSMMRTCKLTPEGVQGDLTHDMMAIQKQVVDDHKLLKAKVQHLSGEAGIERLEHALSDARSKFFAVKDNGSPSTPPMAHIVSPGLSGSENGTPVSTSDNLRHQTNESGQLSRVARSLFKEDIVEEKDDSSSTDAEEGQKNSDSAVVSENELLVNEIVHGHHNILANRLVDEEHDSLKERVKETMENAFWDGIMDSVSGEQPDFSWVLKLVTEVRDELCEISPNNWKQNIVDAVDLDILSQVLSTGVLDMAYLGKVFAFVLVTLQKLSAPANEAEMKATHQTLLKELAGISQSTDSSFFARALIKGLRYVLHQIQILKIEISKARIGFMEPLIKGPAGFDYLQNAFSGHYGPPADAASSLPFTSSWLSSSKTDVEAEWREYNESVSSLELHPQGLPPVTLRTGGSVSRITMHSPASVGPANESETIVISGAGGGGGGGGRGIAMCFPANDDVDDVNLLSSPVRMPRRLRRRLMMSEAARSPVTGEEIEAKLRDADLRRQHFYEFLASKARPKRPTWSSSPPEEELSQRIEARLNAAEQKRIGILSKAQMRLARLDEQRQAAKSGVELRFEQERGQLEVKVVSRVQQAEAKRLHFLKTHRQLRAARKERIAQSLSRKIVQESKYKERVRSANHQKRVAAERKRIGLLEAERSKAHARLMRVQRAANLVYTQREMERMRKKVQLEDRLQRARRQRAEYIRQRKGSQGSSSANMKLMNKEADLFARKLARCWRQFVKSKGTTYSLAKAYEALNINEKSVLSMPFEQLARRIESEATIRKVKSLLDRFETRLSVKQTSQSGNLSGLENIDHLLKRVGTPKRRGVTKLSSSSSGAKKAAPIGKGTKSKHRVSRYPVRIVLCAYMILGHPDAVLSGKGEHEHALAESAVKFIQELEELIKVVLQNQITTSHRGNPVVRDHSVTFKCQLEAFDKAWCSYLYHFVVWKVKDARSLEEDLVRAACQLELSMMRTCKLTPDGVQGDLTHDMKAIQKQVVDDHKLLKAKVQHLSGEAGIERLEHALSDARSKFFAAKDNGSPSTPAMAHIVSPSLSGSKNGTPVSTSDNLRHQTNESGQVSRVARSLFKEDIVEEKDDSSSTSTEEGQKYRDSAVVSENELLVNEIVYGDHNILANRLVDEEHDSLKKRVKETMENAFWDGIMDSVSGEQPDFSWVLKLITEVRDELCEISPSNWKQDIVDAVDLDILSQVLTTGVLDTAYLGKVFAFVLVTLQKLSAPANEAEMKATHQTLLKELAGISLSTDSSFFARALIKGLHYVLHMIQILKIQISKARIGFMEPLIKGPAGFDYLQNAFSGHYGPPADAVSSLPFTSSWLSSSITEAEAEWREYKVSVSSLELHPQGLPSVTLRTGGSVSRITMHSPALVGPGKEEPECKGERTDLLLRLGLLKLVSQIEGLKPETLPETLKLNLYRLRDVQCQVQRIIVISTSMLVLRQTLVTEKLVGDPSALESIVSQSTKRLSELVEKDADIGLPEIVEAITELPESNDLVVSLEKLRAKKEVVASMIAKSLRPGDAIFTYVSHVIYLAMRGAVLRGTGSKGRQLVEIALRRIGATLLTEKVMDAARVLIVVATVSGRVHGAWYENLLKDE